MHKFVSFCLLFFFTQVGFAQQKQIVELQKDGSGFYLEVNGEKFIINGMNWDYIPIGTNAVNAEFWKKPDDLIKAGLDKEMPLLRNMGVNTIRLYTGIPAKWINYIYENYGIYTILNHSFGRYGLTIDGVWTPVTDYSDAKTQKLLLSELRTIVKNYKNTNGLLLYLLGNENNYGLFWAGAETEDLPDEESERAFVGENRGRPMFALMNRASLMIKEMDGSRPVAICNGDVLFLDIIAEECKDVDIYGTNVYRGISFRDLFDEVKAKLDMPVLFTEFGADAFNSINYEEDQFSQAYYMLGNWKEIYENAAGLGKAENCIGGCTFHFTDGWWKFGFDDRKNAEVHDNNASWENGGYDRDFVFGENNMNEEWFGICAKGQTDIRGLYELYPRAAYYALKEAHLLDPYDENISPQLIQNHFDNIHIADAVLQARGDKAAINSQQKVRMSRFGARFSTFNTGGQLITTPAASTQEPEDFPSHLGFDHMQSFIVGVEAKPSPKMTAEVSFNVLGNVADNPIDEIFYENVVRGESFNRRNGNLRVYQADFKWNERSFDAHGFYRTGHFHWGYEGDFFGLYPEANYGPNLDIYNGEILGMEIHAKRALEGLKIAFGPQLWWGANPAVLAKYTKDVGKFKLAGMFHEDIADANIAVSSIAFPVPRTRRASLQVERKLGKFQFQIGGLWGGQPLNGRTFQVAEGSSGNYTIWEDKIQSTDNWGGKAKLQFSAGPFNWYAQGSMMGLVANGGADLTKTFTGWRLKDNGSGNQTNFLSGFTYTLGNLQIAPNFLWQKPILGPMPFDVEGPGRLRNIISDPFVVRTNRETIAGEILLSYDPTPGTWMYEWDNDRVEDAKFAVSAGFVYRHLPTTQDAAIGFFANRNTFAFPSSAPAQDLWESNIRMVSKISNDFGMIANVLIGNAQANGSDERLIQRYSLDLRAIYKKIKLTGQVKIDDWGPFDYHRDFNLTYPLQLMLDLSTSLGKPDWFVLPNTQIGLLGKWRSLDEFSPRYLPNSPDYIPTGVDPDFGSEWELRTYIHINIGK